MKKTLKKIILSIFIILTLFSKQQAHAECNCVCMNHEATLICDSDRDRKKYCTNICY